MKALGRRKRLLDARWVVHQVPDHENGLVHDVRGSNMTGAEAWGLAAEPITDYFEGRRADSTVPYADCS